MKEVNFIDPNLKGIPQHKFASPAQSDQGVLFSKFGSQVTDPSQKAEDEFRAKYVLRSDHDKIVSDKEKQLEDLKLQFAEVGQKYSKLEVKLGLKDGELFQIKIELGATIILQK
jgi:hypothetical protein